MSLRKISIISAIITVSLLFGIASLMQEEPLTEESQVTDSANYNSPLIYFLLILLFVAPASVAGIIASFFKTVKFQIIVWGAITVTIWFGIILIAFMMLNDPTSFGIPENYWGNPLE